MKNNILYILFLCLFATACEDVIELEVPEGQSRLVVDGLISNTDKAQIVKLNYSSPYFSNQPLPPAKNALVVVSDDTGRKDTLQETEAGVYQKAFPAVVGRSYSLYVKTAEGIEYQSNAQQMTQPGTLDSIYYEFQEAGGFNPDEGYFVSIYTSDLAGEKNFYRWRFFINNKLQRQPFDLIFTSDQMIDGYKKVNIPFRRHLLEAGDKARVEQMSISPEAYEFLNLLNSQVNGGGSQFGTPPAPIRGNVKRLGQADEYALGFFMVSAIISKEIEIIASEE